MKQFKFTEKQENDGMEKNPRIFAVGVEKEQTSATNINMTT